MLSLALLSAMFFNLVHSYSAPLASPTAWKQLNDTVGGRLHTAKPFSSPCFGTGKEEAALCLEVQENYKNPEYRASTFSGYSVTQWEGCRSLSEQCLLDSRDPNDTSAWVDNECYQGSVPPYYIDVQSHGDVKAAYKFSHLTGVPLTIKNSGHDFFGRSILQGSLGLWTHNIQYMLYDESFIPEGGEQSYMAITMGAGVSWDSVYAFAEENNVTAIGGYHETVGASGGWVMGGGHSILSPVYGLGVDRVLEFKIVTPDGHFRVANAHKNTDLFWALRGGGGGTYGVVLESTIRVEPAVKLQVVSLTFNRTAENAPPFMRLVVDNSLRWGYEGWGGHIRADGIINVTPLLSLEEARESVKEVTDYALAQNGTAIVEELPSWYSFYQKYVLQAQAGIGYGGISGSWLMPGENFTTEEGRQAIYEGLLATLPYGNPNIIQATPFLFNGTKGETSVTDAWRGSLWHLVYFGEIAWNGTIEQDLQQFDILTNLTANFKAIAPNSGSYFNEGDVREKDWKRAYWGDKYERLLEIKEKYDPFHLLDCYRCVGWKGKEDPRYSCYI